MGIEVGRIAIKTAGRERGKKCVIVDVIDKNFVLITGPKKVTGVKRRRVNVDHLEITSDFVDIKRGSVDDEVIKALRKMERPVPRKRKRVRRSVSIKGK